MSKRFFGVVVSAAAGALCVISGFLGYGFIVIAGCTRLEPLDFLLFVWQLFHLDSLRSGEAWFSSCDVLELTGGTFVYTT